MIHKIILLALGSKCEGFGMVEKKAKSRVDSHRDGLERKCSKCEQKDELIKRLQQKVLDLEMERRR